MGDRRGGRGRRASAGDRRGSPRQLAPEIAAGRRAGAGAPETRCAARWALLLSSAPLMLAQIHYVPDSVQAWLDDPRWWLRNPSYCNPRTKVGVHSVPEVIEALRFVYNEPTCRDMIERGYWVPMLGLFSGAPWVEWSGTMLALGVDLVDAGATNEAWLVERLRGGGAQWLGARLELGVFAGLRRHRYCPTRPDPLVYPKQWDFTLDIDGVTCSVECKTLSSGNDDGNFDHVEQRFQNFVVEFGIAPPCDATFAISEDLRDLVHDLQVQPFYERVMPELTAELQRALEASDLDGVACSAGRFGTVTRTPATNDDGFLGRWIVTGYASTRFHRTRRLVNSFANATANFECAPLSSHRVAVVWLGQDYLDCKSAAQLISDNFDREFREDGSSIWIDSSSFGYEAGVVLGATRPLNASAWMQDRGLFHVGASRSRSSYRIYDAVSAWSYHLEPRLPRHHGHLAGRLEF